MGEQYPVLVTSISSIISGSISRLIVHPLDTIKAKLQIQQGTQFPQFSNIRSCVTKTFAEEGTKGLYRGLTASVVGSIPSVCIYLTSYEIAKQHLLQYEVVQKSPFLAFLSAGMFAETMACAIFVPVDVIKERLQVQSNLKIYNYSGGWDALKTIGRTEGIRGIYRAYGATIASFGPFSALYFMFYEQFKRLSVGTAKEIDFWPSLLCSATAGSLAAWVTNPLDMAKVRMQVVRASKGHSKFAYKSMFHGIGLIYKEEGFRALFQGSLARIMFHTPNTAIIMSITEYVRRIVEEFI